MSEMTSGEQTLKASTTEGGADETDTVAAEGAIEDRGAPQNGTLYELSVTAAAAGATDTLDVTVQGSFDGTTNWFDIVHFVQVLGNGGALVHYEAALPAAVALAGFVGGTSLASGGVRNVWTPFQRVIFTIADNVTTSSFTFAVKRVRL